MTPTQIEFFQQLSTINEKLDQDFQKIIKKPDKTLEEVKKEIRKSLNFSGQEKNRLMSLCSTNPNLSRVNIGEVMSSICLSESNFLRLSSQINIILKESCQECKKKLPKHPYFCFYNQDVRQWRVNDFDDSYWGSTKSHLYLFCSQHCSQKIIFTRPKIKTNKKISKSKKSKTPKETKTSNCDFFSCRKEIIGECWYNTEKNDNKNFCSKECASQHYLPEYQEEEIKKQERISKLKERLNKDYKNTEEENNNSQNNDDNSQNGTQLQSKINKLENKPNKTAEEEELLKNKKKELEKLLNKNTEQKENKDNSLPNWIVPIGIGAVIIAIVGLVWARNSLSKKKI